MKRKSAAGNMEGVKKKRKLAGPADHAAAAVLMSKKDKLAVAAPGSSGAKSTTMGNTMTKCERKAKKNQETRKKTLARKQQEQQGHQEGREEEEGEDVDQQASGVDDDQEVNATSATTKTKKSSSPAQSQDTHEHQNNNTTTAPADKAKKTRFIAFVGNLPYTATIESVRQHFNALNPIDVRLISDRKALAALSSSGSGSGGKAAAPKCRGIAFVEFGRFDHMKTCLEKYHHSEFRDGSAEPRKINIELTAGGGGSKSKIRKEKIRERNAKLQDERAQRMQKLEVAKLEKKHEGKDGADGEAKASRTTEKDGDGNIHPSRLDRVGGGSSRAEQGAKGKGEKKANRKRG